MSSAITWLSVAEALGHPKYHPSSLTNGIPSCWLYVWLPGGEGRVPKLPCSQRTPEDHGAAGGRGARQGGTKGSGRGRCQRTERAQTAPRPRQEGAVTGVALGPRGGDSAPEIIPRALCLSFVESSKSFPRKPSIALVSNPKFRERGKTDLPQSGQGRPSFICDVSLLSLSQSPAFSSDSAPLRPYNKPHPPEAAGAGPRASRR